MPQAGSCTVSLGCGSTTVSHRVDQRARRKILSGAAFDFGGVAFKQPLVDRTFGVEVEAEPGFLTDHCDKPAQFCRVLDFVLRLQEQARR